MSSVGSVIANTRRDALLVVVKANPPVYPVTGANSTGVLTATVGTILRSMGKTVRTPAQGSAPGTNQVVLLKVVVVSAAANSAASGTSATPGEGDSAAPVYVNLLDGFVARV
jgi:hypothetical protein